MILVAVVKTGPGCIALVQFTLDRRRAMTERRKGKGKGKGKGC